VIVLSGVLSLSGTKRQTPPLSSAARIIYAESSPSAEGIKSKNPKFLFIQFSPNSNPNLFQQEWLFYIGPGAQSLGLFNTLRAKYPNFVYKKNLENVALFVVKGRLPAPWLVLSPRGRGG